MSQQYKSRPPVEKVPFIPKFPPSAEQDAIFQAIKYGSSNVHGEAGAGSGKTTTAIWSMTLDKRQPPTTFMAFNKSIVEDIAPRVPSHVVCATAHSIGYKAMRKRFGNVELKKGWGSKTAQVLADYDGFDSRSMKGINKGDAKNLLQATERLVSLVKLTLADENDEMQLMDIADRFNLDFTYNKGGDKPESLLPKVMSILPAVMDQIRGMTSIIDFDDMVWLPIQYDLEFNQTELVYVDESQDLSAVLREVAKRLVGERIITIGDRKQSIYGFAGADTQSIPKIITEFDSKVCPLMTCYRCGHKIVEYINQTITGLNGFKAFEGNSQGEVRQFYPQDKPYDFNELPDGAMILCRRNSGLIRPCFELLKKGRKAVIKGKDIGAALMSLVDSIGGNNMIEFLDRLEVWRDEKISAIEKRANPSQTAIEMVQDQHDALKAISEGCESVFMIKNKLGVIFSDEKSPGITLSSGHKSKGLEADHVVIVQADRMRIINEKSKPDDIIQEENIVYVMLSRAKHVLDLVYSRTN